SRGYGYYNISWDGSSIRISETRADNTVAWSGVLRSIGDQTFAVEQVADGSNINYTLRFQNLNNGVYDNVYASWGYDIARASDADNINLFGPAPDTTAPVISVTPGTDTVELGSGDITVTAPMTIWTAGVPHAMISFNSSSTADQTALASALGFESFDQTAIINYMINNDIEMTVIHANGNPFIFKISSIHVPSENQSFGEGYTGIYLDPRPDTSTLEGDFEITVKPLPWTDAGATADGNETVTASGIVDRSVAGTYTITYTATDAAGNVGTATRTVTVVAPDTTAPVITVTSGTDTVEQGATWTDAGATADGDETVTASGTVDTSAVGTYTITYTATDAAGNVGVVTRTVTIVDSNDQVPSSLSYTVDGNSITITDCDASTSGELIIPSTIEGKLVTKIGSEALKDCSNLTSIIIPDSVTTIGEYAFVSCSKLINITIPDSVTSIGGWAFVSCTSLTGINIPDTVTSIGYACFDNCTSLTSIIIPDSITSIEGGVFANCTALTSITIPDTVTSIGARAFSSCTALVSISIPDSVTSIGDEVFINCTNLTSITIPDNVTSIGDGAFWKCTNLTSITFGTNSNFTSIAVSAFYQCTSLTSITIPDSVTSIGGSAFAGCTSLTSITIPDSVTSIGSGAFSSCTSITSITILDGVTSIGRGAFFGCIKLTAITIPSSVTTIGDKAFSGCYELQDFTFLGNAPTLGGEDVFESATAIAKITISANAEGYGETFGGVTVVGTTVVSKPFQVFNVTSEPFGFSFNTTVDRSYTVEATGDLRRWEAVELFQGSGGEIRFTAKPTSSDKSQFFRIIVE
ncbi:leucine-rich repeat protein, partial [Verrucomicrobiales bacterium]|nr:leucine-rich repeat protein [Verrucomicrobiales bacterium]